MKTVRVRIAVVVNADGEWCSYARSGIHDAQANEVARGGMLNLKGSPNTLHWIEADVPVPEIPEPQTIQGEVKGDGA